MRISVFTVKTQDVLASRSIPVFVDHDFERERKVGMCIHLSHKMPLVWHYDRRGKRSERYVGDAEPITDKVAVASEKLIDEREQTVDCGVGLRLLARAYSHRVSNERPKKEPATREQEALTGLRPD